MPLLNEQDSFWDRGTQKCGVITSVYQLTVQGPWFYKFKWLSLMTPEQPYLFKQETSIVCSRIDDAISNNRYTAMKGSNPELFKLLKILFIEWTGDVQKR